MGAVYRALDRDTGEPVALKVIVADDKSWNSRFAREASLLAEVRHPGVVRYVAHGTTPAGEAWLAMEWLEGEGLDARLSRVGVSMPEAVELVRQAAEAL